MLISIIVPVFNVERYLRKCLDSLCAQTLQDIEVICVDDGSTDGSLAILREYEANDTRFKVITKPNAGYGNSMNLGFSVAQGEYVGVLESDDFCKPEMCETLYKKACEYQADIVRCNIMLYWSEPAERTELVRYADQNECHVPFDPRSQEKCFLLPPALCCMLVRRSIIVDNNLRLLETPGASYQDTSFSFKLWACAGRAVMIPEAFVFYRQDNESSSINQVDKLYDVCEEYSEIERFLAERGGGYESLLPIMGKRKYSAYIWNYKRIASIYHREYAERISHEFKDGAVLDPKLFSSEDWSDLSLLVNDPLRFVERMDVWDDGRVKLFHSLSRVKRFLNLH
ncbi:glycosyltransferase family 2 protein [Eggerthella sp. NSJ-70]|uniref:Glycosyltransferase family 2 protein n=1 Tax=Eggerthella hominis TaxID=2763043 RepID=A0ABR7BQ92_9ACTN|nr:glycosyltransferase family 2 protein [Eggerthella hominis]MBC5583510.1 glycosyltransferase family 2 protein [Eggerthella hominis]